MGCGPSKSKKFEIKKIEYDFSATYTLVMDQVTHLCFFLDLIASFLTRLRSVSRILSNSDPELKKVEITF